MTLKLTNLEELKKYKDEEFDKIITNSLFSHLTTKDLDLALKEINRISKKDGILIATFIPLCKKYLNKSYFILFDGSLLYDKGKMHGVIFHNYSDEEISNLFKDYEILEFYSDKRQFKHLKIRIK